MFELRGIRKTDREQRGMFINNTPLGTGWERVMTEEDVKSVTFEPPTVDISATFELTDDGWFQITASGDDLPAGGMGMYFYPVGDLGIYSGGEDISDGSAPVKSDQPAVWYSFWTQEDFELGRVGYSQITAAVSLGNFVPGGEVVLAGTDLSDTYREAFRFDPETRIASLGGVDVDTTASGDVALSDGTTGGTGSAGAGNQYVELEIGGTVYKVLHDGTV